MSKAISHKLLILSSLLIISSLLVTNQSEDDDDRLIVHLLPHSHDDPGWKCSFSQYYQGCQYGGVKSILDAVTGDMGMQYSSKRTFSQVEMSFFKKYWDEQDDSKREKIQQFIKSGQLEILNGGWVMNDEGAAYYDDIIEQFTTGHQWVKKTFDYVPTVGWSIDPFGHSTGQAFIYTQLGFDGQIMERIPHQEFDLRKGQQEMEMIYRPEMSELYQKSGYNGCPLVDIFTHVNVMKYYFAYTGMGGCVPISCGNIASDISRWIDWLRGEQQKAYPSRILMHHIGCDFCWGGASSWYMSLENVVNYLDAHPELGVTAKFSTPNKYLAELSHEVQKSKIKLAVKTDDFMPYSDHDAAYWTGYYVTRPHFKGFIRKSGRFLQAAKKLVSRLTLLGYYDQSQKEENNDTTIQQEDKFIEPDSALFALEENLSLLQHHDAITGTSKKFVHDDYYNLLQGGVDRVNSFLQENLAKFLKEKYDLTVNQVPREKDQTQLPMFMHCDHSSESYSQCSNTYQIMSIQTNNILITIFNPSTTKLRLVKLKVPRSNLRVVDENYAEVPNVDIICDMDQKDNCDLFFVAEFGGVARFRIFWLVSTQEYREVSQEIFSKDKNLELKFNNKMGDGIIKLDESFKVLSVKFPNQAQTNTFSLDYKYYPGFNKQGDQNSGAYIFRTPQEHGESLNYAEVTSATVAHGPFVTQIKIVREDKVNSTLRIFKYGEAGPAHLQNCVEIETEMSPLQLDNIARQGKEVILTIENEAIQNKGKYFTDSNGLMMQDREFNKKKYYEADYHQQSTSASYHPVQSAIYIQDDATLARMTLMSDRSQGGTSFREGQIELMINRQCFVDDDRGVEEPLQETRQVKMTHWLLFDEPIQVKFRKDKSVISTQRTLQRSLDEELVLFVSLGNVQVDLTNKTKVGYFKEINSKNKEIESSITDNLKVYVRPYSKNQIFLKLQNLNDNQAEPLIFESFYYSNKSMMGILDFICGAGYHRKVQSIVETQLSGVEDLEASLKRRLNFSLAQEDRSRSRLTRVLQAKESNHSTIRLSFLEIQSFLITLQEIEVLQEEKEEDLIEQNEAQTDLIVKNETQTTVANESSVIDANTTQTDQNAPQQQKKEKNQTYPTLDSENTQELKDANKTIDDQVIDEKNNTSTSYNTSIIQEQSHLIALRNCATSIFTKFLHIECLRNTIFFSLMFLSLIHLLFT